MSQRMEYSEGVRILADYALNQSGSGARVAASVLISANSGSFQVKIPDLCLLDHTGVRAAFAVIAGRVCTMRDSESQIDNGAQVMQRVFDKWKGVLLK